MTRTIYIFLLFSLISLTSIAQSKDFSYYKSLGTVQYYERNFLEAVFNLQKASNIKPTDKEILYILKNCYDSIGNKDLSGKARIKLAQTGTKSSDKRPEVEPISLSDNPTKADGSRRGKFVKPRLNGTSDAIDIRQLGDYYFDKESYDSAVKCYKQYFMLRNTDTAVLYYLGTSYYHLQQYDLAIDYFELVAKNEPTRAEVYNWIGVCEYLKGNYLAARDYFKQCLRFDKEYSLAYFNLAKTQYEMEDYANASKNLIAAAQMNPNDADIKKMQADIYYSTGRWDSALSIYLQLVEASPKNEKFNLRTGELFQKTYKWKSSIAYLNAYLEQQPKNAEVQKKLGIAYFYSEEYTQAINLFESAAKTLWNDKDLMLYTAIACNKQENYTKALEYTRRAIALDSHYARAYYQEGVAYRGLKRNKESKQSFEKTKELGLNSMEP